MIGIDLGDWISWKMAAGGLLVMCGMGLMALFAVSLNGTKYMRVPDGVAPDEHYRRWKAAALSRRLSRTAWFLVFMAVGLMLGGCGVVILEVIR